MLLYLILCGFTIWYIQSQKIFKSIAMLLDFQEPTGFFNNLLECSFCIGFWVCLVYTIVLDISFLDVSTDFLYVLSMPIERIITAMVTSVIYSYCKIGIISKHQNIIVKIGDQ